MDLHGFPVFTGSNLESWIEWLEDYFVFHHFTEDEKLNLSQALMEGDAYEWLHRRESFQSWNEMKRELWFRFESPPRRVLSPQHLEAPKLEDLMSNKAEIPFVGDRMASSTHDKALWDMMFCLTTRAQQVHEFKEEPEIQVLSDEVSKEETIDGHEGDNKKEDDDDEIQISEAPFQSTETPLAAIHGSDVTEPHMETHRSLLVLSVPKVLASNPTWVLQTKMEKCVEQSEVTNRITHSIAHQVFEVMPVRRNKQKRVKVLSDKQRKRVKLSAWFKKIKVKIKFETIGNANCELPVDKSEQAILISIACIDKAKSVDSKKIDMLLNSPWKPLDLSAAVKLLCSQQKIQNSEFNEFHSGDNLEDGDNCLKDAGNDTSPEKENLGDTCNGCDENESEEDKLLTPFSLPDEWPISDDPECSKLLEKIRAASELLIRHKYLAASHHDKVIQFTLDELQNLASVSKFLKCGLKQSPIFICFLGASQLRKILKFLQDLSQACGLSRYSEQSNPTDEVNFGDLGHEVTEEILLDGEDSCLLLDEKLLDTECIQDNFMDLELNNGNNVASGADGFLSWIFTGPSSGEQIVSWMRTKEEKTNQGLEIMQILEKEFCHLQNLCERKCEHLNYEGSLQTVEDLCLEEGRKRETSADFTHESYESVLRRRSEELNESDHELVFISSRFELDAITNVLKDAESLNHNQFAYEQSYACISLQLRDLESGEADEWGMKDSLREADSFIEIAIQKQKEQLSAELSRIDARIMRNVTGIQQLQQKLGPVSSNDSLDEQLFDDRKPILSWPQRLVVVKGIASALGYLYTGAAQVVRHRDIKASTIMLDAEFHGRLGDFAEAKTEVEKQQGKTKLLKDWMFKFKSTTFLKLAMENKLLTLELGGKLFFKGGSIDRLLGVHFRKHGKKKGSFDDLADEIERNEANRAAGQEDKREGFTRVLGTAYKEGGLRR